MLVSNNGQDGILSQYYTFVAIDIVLPKLQPNSRKVRYAFDSVSQTIVGCTFAIMLQGV